MKTLLRWLKRTVYGVLAFLLIYAVVAFLLPRIPIHSDYQAPASGVKLFIESNGVHTDFVVPVSSSVVDWTKHLPREWFEQVDASFQYVSFGWGDRGFYLETPNWGDLRFGTAFKATFFLSSTLMHVTYLKWEPPENERCRPLVVSEAQYRTLVEFLLATFERDSNGSLQRVDHAGYTPRDRFLKARGRYSLVRTCNVWTGEGLDAMGVKTGFWTPFAGDVMRYLGD